MEQTRTTVYRIGASAANYALFGLLVLAITYIITGNFNGHDFIAGWNTAHAADIVFMVAFWLEIATLFIAYLFGAIASVNEGADATFTLFFRANMVLVMMGIFALLYAFVFTVS